MLHDFRLRRPLLLLALAAAVSSVAGLLPAAASPAEARAGQPTGETVIVAHTGYALDVSGVSQMAGAQVIQCPPNGQDNQRWTFEPLGDGTYRIVAGHSGQVLDVTGASQAAGARVIQWPWNGGDNQRWRVEDVPGQGSRIVAVHSGLVLDVAGASGDRGARVIQWPWNGGGNQRWERTDAGRADGAIRLNRLCTQRARGVTLTVQYPEGWHANGPPAKPCSAFDPEPFSVEPNTQYPRDLAVVITVEPVGLDVASNSPTVRVLSERATAVDGRRAVRQVVETTGEGLGPAGQESTRYVIDAGTDRSAVASTWNVAGNDYARSVEVLDAMAGSLAVQPVDTGLDGDDVLAPGIDSGPELADGTPPPVSVTDVRLGSHKGFDRVVFEIGGPGHAGWDVRYVNEARSAGSDQPIAVAGDAILRVKLKNVALPPDAPAGVQPWDGPKRLEMPGEGPVVEVVEDTVFEGVHTFFVGVTDRQPFQVNRFGSPERVVIDVAAG